MQALYVKYSCTFNEVLLEINHSNSPILNACVNFYGFVEIFQFFHIFKVILTFFLSKYRPIFLKNILKVYNKMLINTLL